GRRSARTSCGPSTSPMRSARLATTTLRMATLRPARRWRSVATPSASTTSVAEKRRLAASYSVPSSVSRGSAPVGTSIGW
ncbi:hypothetical protein HMPREF0731_4593, partial [Pseudoroseomonas cervicalis ATCC 49957]